MRQMLKFVLVTVLCTMSSLSFAQITGKVTDASTGNELVGASIYLEGNSRGTSTNLDGTFELSNTPSGNLVVKFYRIRILNLTSCCRYGRNCSLSLLL